MAISPFVSLLITLTLATTPATPVDGARMFQDLPPPPGCGTPLAATGKAVEFKAPLEENARAGLIAGLFLTLHDPSGGELWPKAELETAGKCPIARFAAADLVWTIHSGSGRAPLRAIGTPTREDWFALVRGPGLGDAAAWHGQRQGLPTAAGPPAYYLIGVADEQHFLARVYDGPPPMAAVADDVAGVLAEEIAPLAAHDPNGGAVSLFRDTVSGSQAELFRPADLRNGKFARLYMPDGHLFVEGAGGELVFRGSGFACRPAYGVFERARVMVSNPADAGLDLSCSLEADDGLTTVFVTHRPDTSQDKATWTSMIRGVEQETGVVRKLTGPPTGPREPIQAGRMWIDKAGLVELILFMRRGEYVYEIRQTHATAQAQRAMTALAALIEQITGYPAPR